ncbi:hypothetical protein EHQ43_04560 [Leptospira bouyouniensis]|uniref:DUF2079 domain-containing protein n=1 Tax=Leptospira bouyouniensis TaxID=2484911 RepID=A0A7I0HWA8_9LEPT|nr:hypothetical protein [Leptospira bouyouniensis]TGL08322.1 hypothetical protein EHQ43_04560 [Leptospira bouyouniensis]
MKQIRWFKPFFFLLVLFASFHLFYDVIYENHLGEGTDSDVLYPYLFAKDVWNGKVSGWNLPPSTTLFPDGMICILLYPLTGSVYSFHLVYGFFVFLLPFIFAKSLGLSNSLSTLTSLGFLILAGLDPNQLGQFYFPSFHGMTFILAAWALMEIERWNDENKEFPKQIRFLFLMTMIWISEYWFFVNLAPFLFLYGLVRLRWKIIIPIGSTLLGFFIAKLITKGFRTFGIGTIGTESFELIPKLKILLTLLFQNPIQSFDGILISSTKNPFINVWWERYLVFGFLFFILSIFHISKKNIGKEFLFFLSPFFTMVFLYGFQIEPNIRYLYILPFGTLYFLFRSIELFPWFRKIIPVLILVGLFIFYLSIHSDLITKIKTGESRRTNRLTCLEAFNPHIVGAATYWPIKYIYAFSNQKWTLVPFTKDGTYYPWVANTSWDGESNNLSFSSFVWGVTDSKENLEIWKGVELVKECEGWYFFQRNSDQRNTKPKN